MLDTFMRRATQKATIQKATTGPGAAVMSWGIPISEVVRNEHQMMKEAQIVYARGNRWVKRAEMTISGRVGGVPWHLETPDGESVTDDSPEQLRAIRDLFEKPLGDDMAARQYPTQPSTRRSQWGVTSRHMGLCNVAFWLLDELDRAIGFPRHIFQVRPDRVSPRKDNNGRLIGWTLDKDSDGSGTDLSLEELLPFYLDQPDRGEFGTGLVESIMSTVGLPSSIDRHAMDTLGSGGRLAGIYAPKAEAGNDVFDRLVSDLRTIKDMPDSSKRDVVARAPIDFTPTAADMASLSVISLSQMSRDDVLAHWGVPLSTIGGYTPAGMNSGETRKYDEAALWQNAVQFRLDALQETIQYRLLDRLKAIGIELELVLETPEFDDDAPKYDLAVKSQGLPLTNSERRAILGLDPFGVPAIDEAIWMPSGIVPVGPAAPGALIEQVSGGLLSIDEARANMGLTPMEWSDQMSHDEVGAVIAEVESGLISIDEARAKMGLTPMVWDTTPDTDELVKQLSAGLLTIDEAREVMGRTPMEWDDNMTHDEIGALIAKVEAGLMTHDEARELLGLAPLEWSDGLSHDEVGALIAEVEAGLVTHDEARAQLKLAPAQWSEDLSHDEVGALIAKVESGLMTHDEARGVLNLPPMQWDEDTGEKIKQAGELVRAGFDPDDVMRTLGLPPIKHLGLPPVTVQKLGDAEGLPGAPVPFNDPAKARMADLRTATARLTPQIEKAVAKFLAEQKAEIAARVKAKAGHLSKKPGDVSVWWNADEWDKKLADVLRPYAAEIARTTAKHTAHTLESDR